MPLHTDISSIHGIPTPLFTPVSIVVLRVTISRPKISSTRRICMIISNWRMWEHSSRPAIPPTAPIRRLSIQKIHNWWNYICITIRRNSKCRERRWQWWRKLWVIEATRRLPTSTAITRCTAITASVWFSTLWDCIVLCSSRASMVSSSLFMR